MKISKILAILCIVAVLTMLLTAAAYAASPDVSGAIQSTWDATKSQIKSVVDNVVFPALDVILAVFFFVKLGGAYFDYRKHGQFEWVAPVVLFGSLVFTLTAPTYDVQYAS